MGSHGKTGHRAAGTMLAVLALLAAAAFVYLKPRLRNGKRWNAES